jgi:hypothetical protein
MLIVTAERGQITVPASDDHQLSSPDSSSVDPTAEARSRREAIDHHRTELAKLLDQRLRHVAQLHASGWQIAPIGRLYKLTRERARQLLTAARGGGKVSGGSPDAPDDGAVS